ncbi:MAG: hypothetical protein P8K80_08355, partial [Phycisphaerales bacterium]|nr:hypothetical protein [Phycisphaerales bacterium]
GRTRSLIIRITNINHDSPERLDEAAALAVDMRERDGDTPMSLELSILVSNDRSCYEDVRGRRVESQRHAAEAVRLARLWIELHGEGPQAMNVLAEQLKSLAIDHEMMSDFSQARVLYQESIEHGLAIADRSDETPGVLGSLRRAYVNLGDVDRREGQFDPALSNYEKALSHGRKAVELSGQSFLLVDAIAVVHDRRAAALGKLGRLDAAAAAKDDEIQLRREMLGLAPSELLPHVNRDLAVTLRERIDLARQAGDDSIEAELLGEAVAIEAEYPDEQEDA